MDMTGTQRQRTDLEELLGIDVAHGPGRHEILWARSRHPVERSNEAFKDALQQIVLLLVIGFFAVDAAGKFTNDKLMLWTLWGIVILANGIWAYRATRYAPASVWETMTWLDLDDRSWNTYMRYPDGALPTTQNRVPFADLAVLFDGSHIPEDPEWPLRYSISLCLREKVEQPGNDYDRGELSKIEDKLSEEHGRDMAIDLATRYGIVCWERECKWVGGSPSRMIRLC